MPRLYERHQLRRRRRGAVAPRRVRARLGLRRRGFAAVGLDGISVHGNGTFYGIMAESSDSVPDGVFSSDITSGLKAELGRLIQVNPSGRWKVVADVGHSDFEWAAEHKFLVPDQFPDANPYGVLALPGTRWVVDAASNTLDRVRPNGDVSVVAFFQNPPVSDAVPTCLDRGPDGALYVGELTGGGNVPGSSVVWRFAPLDPEPTIWASVKSSFIRIRLPTWSFSASGGRTLALVRVLQL